MKILVTGAKGFIGKNLIAELKNRGNLEVFEFDYHSPPEQLDAYTKDCSFVFHLAGANRPENENEFMEVNFGLTAVLLDGLKKHSNKVPVLMSSSIQALLDNPYGKSKKAGEDLVLQYQKETGSKVYVYRLQNVFGKWCRPNYNSVIATFCHNVTRNLPITINNEEQLINLVYIDDVVNTFISAMEGKATPAKDGLYYAMEVYPVTLGEIADLIHSFWNSRNNLLVPDMSDSFKKKLYSTYLSYLPVSEFGYSLKMNTDSRGSFTEFIKTLGSGQISVNISKPGITKGNHWHQTKNEKFLVVSGYGVICLRKIDDDEIIEYNVSGERMEVIDIPPGYTHNITNLGDTDLVTIMWANEIFDTEKPDTHAMKV